MKKSFKASLLPVAVAAASLMGAVAAHADGAEWHGYFRTQVGTTSAGGNLQCFSPGGANSSKFRLGNECDDYAEASLGLPFGDANGVWGKYHVTFAYKPTAGGDYEAVGSSTEMANRENYFEAGGFFDKGALEDAKLWVGKRFYNRTDIHINDYYYWENSGPGAGIEEIKIGSAKAAVAYLQGGGNDKSATTEQAKRLSLRAYDITTNENGKLEGEYVSIRQAAPNGPNRDGSMYMLQHVQSGFLGGFNKIALLGGTNVPDQTWAMGIVPTWAGGVTGTATPTDPRANLLRLHESFAFDLKGTNWSGMLSASLGKINGDTANYDFWNVGVRPQYNFSANKSIAIELSHTEGSNATAGGDRPMLNKLTIAPQLTLSGGFWARPVLRAFVTYAQWNDAARANGIANGVFGNANNGTQVGFQAEAWW